MRLTNTFSIEEVEAAIAAILDDDPVSSGDERIRGVISDFELGGVIADLQYLVKGEDLLSEDDAEVKQFRLFHGEDELILTGVEIDLDEALAALDAGTLEEFIDANLEDSSDDEDEDEDEDPDDDDDDEDGDDDNEGGSGNGGGRPTFDVTGTDGDDVLRGRGRDEEFDAGLGNDRVFAGGGADTVLGGEGDDTLNGGGKGDELSGGLGNDLIRGQGGRDVVNGDEGDDVILGNGGGDELFGGLDNDKIKGQGGGDLIEGGDGADTLIGGGGKDDLSGGDGDDVIKGGGGRDTIDGGAGVDAMNGGGGRDTFLFSDGAESDEIDGFKAGDDVIDFSASTTVTTFADLTIADGVDGAEISSSEGVVVVLNDVSATDVTEDDFLF